MYGNLNQKRFQRREDKHASEFILFWDDGSAKSSRQNVMRATTRININDFDKFIKFTVTMNELPIQKDKVGKDVVVDWSLYDDFDTDRNLWIDANGLQMI